MQHRKPVLRLAQLRKQTRLTQLEVSQLLGVTKNTYANWEKEKSGIDWIERIVRLCKLFDCKAEDLIEYVVDTQVPETNQRQRRVEDLRRKLNPDPPTS
jgi:transcriptional regulator with XRE-family HTH domain